MIQCAADEFLTSDGKRHKIWPQSVPNLGDELARALAFWKPAPKAEGARG